MLQEMLKQSQAFQELPIPDQQIYYKLSGKFQQSTSYLFMNPEELQDHTSIGTQEQWHNFLNLQEVQNYIKGQMAFLSQIAQRKTFVSLVQSALEGNHQAAKQVQELSGIMNQQDLNRTVVLHYVPRPNSKNNQTKEE